MEKCDYFVIGGGSGGVRSARIASQLGAKVILAEKGDLGGTCVNVGCIPKKLFSYAAGFKREFKMAANYGWLIDDKQTFNWTSFIAHKNKEISRLNNIYQKILDTANVKVLRGAAKFLSNEVISVAGKEYLAKHTLIATGGVARKLNIPNEGLSVNSDQIFYLDKLPNKILIVGGGYIATEFASIFNGFGAEVHISYRKNIYLQGFDMDIRLKIQEIMKGQGIKFRYNTNLKSLAMVDGLIKASFDDHSQDVYDKVLLAVGRDINIEGLGLANTLVKVGPNGKIIVDQNMATTDDKIFAVGDVSSPLDLTPVAIKEGMHLANRLFGDGKGKLEKINYDQVPSAVFTHPNIATVGLSEDEARARGIKIKVYRSNFVPMKIGFAGDKEECLIKMVTSAKDDKILGLHLIGDDTPEIMQGFAVAISLGATKDDLAKVVGIHPTLAEEVVTMN
ncbi:MAG: glutathione-disulfide reductase [SAR324 cluster bacterium]|nr:glutathione-disulfide reductase [SAR324 cluster bacterium]